MVMMTERRVHDDLISRVFSCVLARPLVVVLSTSSSPPRYESPPRNGFDV